MWSVSYIQDSSIPLSENSHDDLRGTFLLFCFIVEIYFFKPLYNHNHAVIKYVITTTFLDMRTIAVVPTGT